MEKENALVLLEQLVDKIWVVFVECSKDWIQYCIANNIAIANQKSVKVVHTIDNPEYWEMIHNYDDYLNASKYSVLFDYDYEDFRTNSRVKAHNSIDEKRDDYINYKPERGEVSISKCFNDIFGVRAIIDCELKIEDLSSLYAKYEKNIIVERKDVPANKSGYGYKAIHIYFKTDNQNFRWELQIWNKCYEHSNMESHKYHRYKYAGWESKEKSGW